MDSKLSTEDFENTINLSFELKKEINLNEEETNLNEENTKNNLIDKDNLKEEKIENNSNDDSNLENQQEEEELEPKLIYERMANDLTSILQRETISCSVIYSRFIIFGTYSGKLFILDHQGNIVQNPLQLHETKVKDVSIEEKGEYVASCSDDKVIVVGIFNSSNNSTINEQNINSVALDPNFYKSSNKNRLVIASNKVILLEKNFLLRYKSTVLFYDDKKISLIRWKDQLLAWSNNESIRIYDLEERNVISYIKRDTDFPINSFKYKCNFYWLSNNKLLIGWGNSVKLCKIEERKLNEIIEKKLPRKFVLIPSLFEIEECICGIAPFRNNIIAICLEISDSLKNENQPYIKIMEPHVDDFTEISNYLMPIKNFENYKYIDYQLEYLFEDNLYFIISPKDVIIAKPKEEDDHIEWLINKNKFEQALKDITCCKQLKKYNLSNVGKLYLKYLIEQNTDTSLKKAAELSEKYLELNKACWEELILQFLQKSKLHLLEPYIPIDERLSLSPEIGEIVLNYFLEYDSNRFLKIIRKWPPRMYNVLQLINTVESTLSLNTTNEPLYEALAELHIHQGDFDKALADYLSVNNKEEIFDLIEKYSLINSLRDKMEILMNLNPNRASDLLIENMLTIPIDYVFERLKNQKKLLLPYLHKVIKKDSELCINYHENLVELYANYSPKNLLDFLKSSNNYSLEKALKICTDLKLIPEVVFLLTRMGNAKKALDYIINSMNDINYAVSFCQQNSDNELWEELFKHSLKKTEYIPLLIQNIGTHIPDPINFINRIPENTKIDNLVGALIKILSDYNLQISLEECCERILLNDCNGLMSQLNKMQKRGTKVNEFDICNFCSQRLIFNEIKNCSDIVIFNCKHMYHERCLPETNESSKCSVCLNSTKQNLQNK